MDVSNNTTTRLRRAFAYRSDQDNDDDDDADDRLALDEQEQEDLIQTLAEQNEIRNAQFSTALLALPALAALPYIVVLLLTRGAGASDRLVALLSLSSLGSTGYMLRSLAPGVTGIWHLDAWSAGVYSSSSQARSSSSSAVTDGPDYGHNDQNHNDDTTTSGTGLIPDYAAMGGLGSAARRKRRRSSASSFGAWFPAQKTPLELYLPYLNIGLCVVLVLLSAARASSSSPSSLTWGDFGLGNLPAIVYAVVLLAKVVMSSVDPEKELNTLRYQYKGA